MWKDISTMLYFKSIIKILLLNHNAAFKFLYFTTEKLQLSCQTSDLKFYLSGQTYSWQTVNVLPCGLSMNGKHPLAKGWWCQHQGYHNTQTFFPLKKYNLIKNDLSIVIVTYYSFLLRQLQLFTCPFTDKGHQRTAGCDVVATWLH